MEPRTTLAALEHATTTSDALAFYDTLPAVTVDRLRGAWRGSGLPTGHPLDGVLEALGWRGKRFGASPDDAHPLVFTDGRGGLVDVNPAFAPLALLLRFPGVFRRPLTVRAFRALLPLVRTRRPRARLRRAECPKSRSLLILTRTA